MRDGRLTYDGTTYRLDGASIPGLLARGVIVIETGVKDGYELAVEHVIEDIGADSIVVAHRTGAEARGEGSDDGKRGMIAVQFMHRDGQGGR